MVHSLAIILLTIYGICLLILWVYSLGSFFLAIGFWKQQKVFSQTLPPLEGEKLPFVTIQLPIYNEKYVIERLIDAVSALDYPTNCFEIQVLDDSNDESSDIIERKIPELAAKGISLKHIRREVRTGYKAGALSYAHAQIKGDFLLIFDADFVPRPDFLRAMLPYLLQDENIGLVQTRWEHLNAEDSLLTRAQAFHLDAHFAIEQFVRNKNGYFMHFNGTAGIWRKKCIEEAGGWEIDTLTEDVDVSYRAQLKGWKLEYVDNVGAPAELPMIMSAVKSQQFRWMKGGAEVARKLLRKIWQSDQAFLTKCYASQHLLGSSVFIVSFLAGVLSLPILLLSIHNPTLVQKLVPLSNLLFSSVLLLLFFYFTASFARNKNLKTVLSSFLSNYLIFISFILGLSFHNSRAAWLGLRKKSSPFVRTPKFNQAHNILNTQYAAKKLSKTLYVEMLMTLYFLFGTIVCIVYQSFISLPFQLSYLLGYGSVVFYSLRERWR